MAKPSIPSKLKICLIARKFPIQGRAASHGFLWPIAKSLSKRGHQVTVLASRSPQGRSLLSQDGVNAHYLLEGKPTHMNSQFTDIVAEKCKEMHKESAFDIIHSIDDSGYRIGKAKKHLKVPVAYDVEATQIAQLFSILGMAQETLGSIIRTSLAVGYKFLSSYYGRDRWLLKTADGVIVTSPMQRVVLERYYLYPDSRIFNVPYGIEISDLQPKQRAEVLREELGIPQFAKTVVTVTDMADLGEMKNLLLAFQKVTIKKPNTRLIIVGNGPRKKEIEYEMLQLALGNRVHFIGAVKNTELPDYISLGDVYVDLSSRTSGFEPPMLEAMAQEKVIIGSEVSPISIIVEDGINGFLIRPADINTLSSLILDIFAENLMITEIGIRARSKVLDIFDTEKMVDQTLHAYIKILQRSGYYTRKNKEDLI